MKMRIRDVNLLFIVMVLSASAHVPAADLEYVGSLGGEIRDSVACQGYVFLAQGKSIIILDAKDKNHLREISRYRSDSDSVDALAVKWPILFFIEKRIGDSSFEVSTLEIKDPAHPREIKVGEDLEGNIIDLATSGSLLLTNMHHARIQLFDISDPYHPQSLPSGAAYERWGEDIRTGEMINKLKSPLNIPVDVLYSGSVQGVLVEGQRAYLLDDKAVLKAFDLTDPKKPRRIQSIKNADKIKSQIESQIKGFDNESKTFKDHFRIIREEQQDDGREGEQITIQDIANKNAPKRLSSLAKTEDRGQSIEKFGIVGDRLFVVNSESRKFYEYSLSVYDINKPEKPLRLGSFVSKIGEIPGNIAMSGDRIYLADHERGLIILRFAKEEKSEPSPKK